MSGWDVWPLLDECTIPHAALSIWYVSVESCCCSPVDEKLKLLDVDGCFVLTRTWNTTDRVGQVNFEDQVVLINSKQEHVLLITDLHVSPEYYSQTLQAIRKYTKKTKSYSYVCGVADVVDLCLSQSIGVEWID